MNISCPSRYVAAEADAAVLLKLLGGTKFAALQKTFGGRRIWIPKAGARPSCLTCKERDKCIITWRQQGQRVDLIARHLGVSAKTVYRVLERAGWKRSSR